MGWMCDIERRRCRTPRSAREKRAFRLVLFGGAKLPSLARSLGEAKREFEKATNEGSKTDDDPPTG